MTQYRIENIGPVNFERSPRAKRINITVRPFKGVRVAVPCGVSFKQALSFAADNRPWIKNQLEKIAHIEKEHATLSGLFENIDRETAGKVLRQRIDDLAQAHGFSYNRVYIRNQKTRWGSCSTKNNINLNIKLTRLPEKLMDYVILHELVHTRIKNHGNRFYAWLDKLVSNRKTLDKMLKAYGIGLS